MYKLIGGICLYAITWSFGVSVDTTSKKLFDQTLKRTLTGDITSLKKKKTVPFPEKLMLFDYLFRVDPEKLTSEWVKWTDLIG